MSGTASDEVAIRDFLEREAHSMLAATLSAVPIGVMLTTLDHLTLAVNRKFGEIWGVEHKEIVRSDVQEVRALVLDRFADFEAWAKNIERVYSDPAHVQVDELLLVNPSAVILRYTGPVRNDEGEIIGRLWTFEDITALAKTRRLGETISQVSLLVDPDPSIVYEKLTEVVAEFYGSLALLSIVEDDLLCFHAISGLGEQQARQMGANRMEDSFCQFCLGADAPTIIQDSRHHEQYAEILPNKLGLTRYAGVPLRSPQGKPIGTLCILDSKSDEILDEEDIRFLSLVAMRIGSELERERQLTLLRSNLQQKTDELEIAQAEMIQKEKLAVIGTLSASVAHDIRNILSAVSLEIAMGTEHPEKTLQTVRQHLDRFNVLSHRLLSYAKPKQVVLEPVCLIECLDRVVSLLSRNLELANIELAVTCEEGLPPVYADRTRLDHLFVNLILNAMQAMKNGGCIGIRALTDGDRIVAEVADSGSGMSEDQLQRLFQPFHSKKWSGFGLGLYSVKRIVDESGGTISHLNGPTGGTIFRISWPRKH